MNANSQGKKRLFVQLGLFSELTYSSVASVNHAGEMETKVCGG